MPGGRSLMAGQVPLTGGELNAAITSALVGIHSEYLGRGPKSASTFHHGNVLVTLMYEVLTPAEKSLAGANRGEAVSHIRQLVERWPLREQKRDYLLWAGRMDPVKGAHRAIEAARLAGRPLVLAGPVQAGQEHYFREWIEPHLDGRRVRYVGEVAGPAKRELFASAAALLMPVRWREPFGMVMVEALACGTPVIAFPEGAAVEIVIDGENGMLVADEAGMGRAVHWLHSIDPLRCRASVVERYDVAVSAAGYERVYREAIDARRRHGSSLPPRAVLERRRVQAQPASTSR